MKIIGMMLVKNEANRYLENVLQQLDSICDEIIVLDDGSTDNTRQICEDYTENIIHYDESTWETNELYLRRRLWDFSIDNFADNGDWILCLDADELMSDRTLDRFKEFVKFVSNDNAAPEQTKGIAFQLFDMWDITHYRSDNLWNAHNRPWVMAVQYKAGFEYKWRETPLHCGRFPLNAAERFYIDQTDPLKLLHFGWATPEDRVEKYTRYMRADPQGVSGSMAQYESILDETPHLIEFSELVPNSQEWWDKEFINNWEVGIDGKQQTRYFMDLILSTVPSLYFDNKTVLDWGCALGQGVDAIRKEYKSAVVDGYDFSKIAINKAIEVFGYGFKSTLPDGMNYNTVVCSNVLEHFKNPISELEKICSHAIETVIIMCPHDQKQLNEVHVSTINANNMPQIIAGFERVQTVILPDHNPAMGGGEQILFVYRKKEKPEGSKRILLAIPVRQDAKTFDLYLNAIDNLVIPENCTMDKLFILHNSKKLIYMVEAHGGLWSLYETRHKVAERNETTHIWNATSVADIVAMKNAIVEYTLNNDYDYVFMPDSDLILHPKTLLSLYEADKDIIAECFWTKWLPQGDYLPNAWMYDSYSGVDIPFVDMLKNEGIYKIGMTGACILVKRQVYESKGVNYQDIYNLGYSGEDRFFCVRAACAGFDIYLDTKYPCIHLYRESETEKYLQGEISSKPWEGENNK